MSTSICFMIPFLLTQILWSDSGTLCCLLFSPARDPPRYLKADKSRCDYEDYGEDNNDTRLTSCPVLSPNKLLGSFADLSGCHFDRLLWINKLVKNFESHLKIQIKSSLPKVVSSETSRSANSTSSWIFNTGMFLDRKAWTRHGGHLVASAPIDDRRKVLLTRSTLWDWNKLSPV